MARSCLRWAIVYVVLGVLFSAAIYLRFPQLQIALGAGFGAAVLAWFGIAYLLGSRHAEGRLIARAMKGDRLRDGEKIGVVGRIASSGESLESPVARKRCVAYEYKFLRAGSQAGVSYEGFHLASARIEGPQGAIRILAYPELDFPQEQLHDQQHYRNAKEYIERTTFTKVSGIDLKQEFGRMKTLLADDDGKIETDVHREYLAPASDLSDLFLSERTLASGEEVCAIGTYSAARGGLVPDTSAILHPLKILKGDPAKIVSRMRRRHALDIFMGFGCLTPVVLAAFIALVVVPLTAIEQMFPEKDPTWEEIRLEELLQRKVRPRVRDEFNIQVPDTTIQLNPEEVRGKFAIGKETTALTSSYATRDSGTNDVWLMGSGTPPPGIQLRIRDDGRVDSLRVIGGETIRPPNLFAEQFTHDETDVQGRVTYLEPEGGLRLRATFRAPVQGKREE